MLPDNTQYELAQHLAREEENDRRAEERKAMIEERANELMKEGGECYPFDPANMQEAIAQSDFYDSLGFMSAIRVYVKAEKPDVKLYLGQQVAIELELMANKYWQSVALVIADKEVKL